MMTQQLEVSILAAPLAAIDRRVLSQAWYSALRLAQKEPVAQARRMRPVRAVRPLLVKSQQEAFAANPPTPGPIGARGRAKALADRAVAAPGQARDPRRRGSTAFRSFGEASHDRFIRYRRATFSLGCGNARVVVVLQTRGTRVTLVALCRPELRLLVARALIHVRVALAARGIGVDTNEKGVQKCFSMQR